jgi:hypothetical protein
LPLLCDSTAKGGRLPQATRGCLCSTSPCALIGALHCGAPTYRARSLTPAPVAPTQREHGQISLLGGVRGATLYSLTRCPLIALPFVPLCFGGRRVAFGSTPLPPCTVPPRLAIRRVRSKCGGLSTNTLAGCLFRAGAFHAPHTFETQPKGQMSFG